MSQAAPAEQPKGIDQPTRQRLRVLQTKLRGLLKHDGFEGIMVRRGELADVVTAINQALRKDDR